MASVELFLLYQIDACDVTLFYSHLMNSNLLSNMQNPKNDLDLFPKGWPEACDGSASGNEALAGWGGRGVLVISFLMS